MVGGSVRSPSFQPATGGMDFSPDVFPDDSRTVTDTIVSPPISKMKAHELILDVDRIQILLKQKGSCSWWDWEAGSSLIFWCWGRHTELAREGMMPYISGELPNTRRPARKPPKAKYDLVADKLRTIVDRQYVRPGLVKCLTDYFDVPKGEDIRLVYNGTSCGLNQAVWAPNFWLPYPKSAIRALDFGYYSADMDLAEMFLNFPLHTSIQAYSGVDLTPFKPCLGIEPTKSGWYRWTRNWMGARPSLFFSVRFYYLAEEFCRGNRKDEANPLRWDTIVFNLPGAPDYDPSKPRVFKWDSINKRMAGEIATFVDDLRLTGQTVEHTWRITRVVSSRLQRRGLQDAYRKRRPPTQDPGAGAGAVFKTTATSVTKTVTKEKWLKGRVMVLELWDILEGPDWASQELDYKTLERVWGFLGHLSMTYEILVPYLKGFHLTLASFLPQRDQDGWKLTDKEWAIYLEAQKEKNEDWMDGTSRETVSGLKPPVTIKPVEQLRNDIYGDRASYSKRSYYTGSYP
jgi:hypothetical protein